MQTFHLFQTFRVLFLTFYTRKFLFIRFHWFVKEFSLPGKLDVLFLLYSHILNLPKLWIELQQDKYQRRNNNFNKSRHGAST